MKEFKTLEQFQEEFRIYGRIVYKRGVIYTHYYAKMLYRDICDRLPEEERLLVKKALISLGKNGTNWDSRGQFVAQAYFLRQGKTIEEFVQLLIPACIDHLETANDLLESDNIFCQNELLDVSSALDGYVRFQRLDYTGKVPCVMDQERELIPISAFFFGDVNDLASRAKKTSGDYDFYTAEMMGLVLQQSPILPLVVACHKGKIEIENDCLPSGEPILYGKPNNEEYAYVISESEHSINGVNAACFLMEQKNITLGQAMDTLITANNLDIPLRTNNEVDQVKNLVREIQLIGNLISENNQKSSKPWQNVLQKGE